MIDSVNNLLRQKNIISHLNQGITICAVSNQDDGVDLAKELINVVVDGRTAFYLSGGKTPKNLYEQLARSTLSSGGELRFMPGAVGQVDDRYGDPFHSNSNQKMIGETGLLRYLEVLNIPFYSILHPDKTREETAQMYDEKLRSLNSSFQNSVAILGIGADGHTAGIPASKLKIFDGYELVAEYNDSGGKYGERVTMTFLGLSMIDTLIVLVFGDDKKEALELMFQDGSEPIRQAQDELEIPARFYKRPEIAKKTIIITDQMI